MPRIILISFYFLGLFLAKGVLAYEVGTHEFLTKAAIDFYNQNFSENKIPENYKSFIISGANHEDDTPRWMNHFYDPVYNRGLTKIPGNWVSSKDWAHNSDKQISALYNPVLNTTIAGLLAVTNPGELRKTDFTWERAIRDYLKGDKERAFRGLGQILHLIEDASVPDHTRNDPHPAFNHEDSLETGSPYELWTGDFNLNNPDKNLSLRLSNKKPITLNDLNSYFDGLAKYSNNNFYSKDTINSEEYKFPSSDYFGLGPDGKRFGFKRDAEFGDYYLIRSDSDVSWRINKNELLKNKYIMQDYWNRLSVKAVQHAAGVIDLFFKEVEKAKNDPSFVKEEPKSLLAQVVDSMRGLVANITSFFDREDDLELVAEIPLDTNEKSKEAVALGDSGILDDEIPSGSEQNKIDRNNRINTDNFVDNQDEDAAETANKKNEEVATTTTIAVATENNTGALEKIATTPVKSCSFATDKTPTHQKLIINEVAWMGGFSSANDEWMELKNISGDDLDISGWHLLDKDEQIKITFPSGTKLSSGGFMLLERTDDNSVPGIAANLIYAGALSNTNEGLRLFDLDCNLVDEVLAASDWPSGDAAARKTMERGSDLSWHAHNGDGENFGGAQIMGTPKKENSSRYVPGGGNGAATENQQVSPAPAIQKILISEVQTTGGTGQADNEFIELYNPNDSAIDLVALPLKLHIRNSNGTDNNKTLTFINSSIPARGYFLIGPSVGYSGSVPLDVTYLASSGNKLVNNGGVYLSKSASADVDVLDKVGWGTQPAGGYEATAFSENPIANQSLERKALQNNSCVSAQSTGEFLGNGCDTDKNQTDFEIRGSPKPQNSKSFIEPRSAPSAVSNFNAEYASSTLGVLLSWDASADYLGSTSTTQYVLSYATSTGATLKELITLTATTTYKFTTEEVGLTYDFSILAKDKEGLASDSSTTKLSVPSQLANFYFYKDIRTASSTKYLAEFSYNNYPFIQDLYWNSADSSWKILVFYLNKEAPKELELNAGNNWQPGNLSGVLDIVYANCASGNSTRFSLILPDIESQCNNGGGVANSAFKFSNLEDPHILLELATTTTAVTFTNQDFVTVGTYALYQTGGGDQKFKLVALDWNKYYFSTSTPAHQAPAMPANLEFKVNSSSSLLRIIWDKSQDDDSLDNLLTYEINYATTTLNDGGWISAPGASLDPGEASEVNGRPFTKVGVEPNNTYNIALRAKDDFGNVSLSTTTTYFIPEVSPPYGMSNIRWGYINSSSTAEVAFNANAYPFVTANNTGAILFFLNQLPPASYSFSNNAERWTIGGSNSVLKLQYNTCQSNNDSLLGGLLMHNDSSCPNSGSGLRKNSVRKDLTSGQTNFTTTVVGVLTNGGTESHTFAASDYLTMGFYERNGSTFEEVSVYNKKIYFQE